jgi:hypothetical protein
MIRHTITSAARFLAALLGSAFLAGGCTSTSVYAPEHLRSEPDETVTVLLTDGRSIRFHGGDYAMSDSSGGMLTGKGELLTGKVDNSWTEWEGSIPVSEIKSVSTTDLSVLGILTLTGVGVILVTAVVMLRSERNLLGRLF